MPDETFPLPRRRKRRTNRLRTKRLRLFRRFSATEPAGTHSPRKGTIRCQDNISGKQAGVGSSGRIPGRSRRRNGLFDRTKRRIVLLGRRPANGSANVTGPEVSSARDFVRNTKSPSPLFRTRPHKRNVLRTIRRSGSDAAVSGIPDARNITTRRNDVPFRRNTSFANALGRSVTREIGCDSSGITERQHTVPFQSPDRGR